MVVVAVMVMVGYWYHSVDGGCGDSCCEAGSCDLEYILFSNYPIVCLMVVFGVLVVIVVVIVLVMVLIFPPSATATTTTNTTTNPTVTTSFLTTSTTQQSIGTYNGLVLVVTGFVIVVVLI